MRTALLPMRCLRFFVMIVKEVNAAMGRVIKAKRSTSGKRIICLRQLKNSRLRKRQLNVKDSRCVALLGPEMYPMRLSGREYLI